MPVAEKRFRIAFSFAGEVRDFVEKTANILAAQFGQEKILYDKFHESEFGRWDLGIYLPKFYGEQSDLIVAVLSPAYDEKRWTGWEWVHIYGLLTKADGHRVLTCRFKYAQADGLSPTAGFIELDHKTPEQFVEIILERLAINEGFPRNQYKSSSTAANLLKASIPNNLPRLPFFFGRDQELKRMAAALAPGSRTWGVLIDGPGGIGKTALAIRAAQLVPANRFQRIVFLSAKERELTADGQRSLGGFVLPTFLEMLNAIAREMQQAELMKQPEGQRAEDILRAMNGKGILLVLDNLETLPEPDRDGLFTFLNRLPGDCSAIVTSRRRADAGAVSLRLDRLDATAALELMEELAQDNAVLAGTTNGDRKALYEQTGGNPLLLRWVIGQLGKPGYKNMDSALSKLRSPDAANNPLEFIFGDLLDTFTATETKVLAALTHFTLPAEVKHIAGVANLNHEAAQGALDDLSSRALVMPDLEDRRFQMVALVADYLRKKRPEVIAETGDMLEKSAYALVVENGYTEYDRFPMLEEAWSMVAAALPLFVQGDNGRLQKASDALVHFLNFSGRWDEWMKFFADAEKRAVVEGDFQNAGWRAYQIGHIHFLRSQSTAVLACAARAEEHWEKAKVGKSERATATRLRGIGHEIAQEYEKAAEAYQEAFQLQQALEEDSVELAFLLNDLGSVRSRLQQYDEAEKYYLEGLRIVKAFLNGEGVANITGNLASLKLDQEIWFDAEQLAREALVLAEKLGRQELVASNNHRIATALLRQGKKVDALPYAKKAVEIYQGLDSAHLQNAHDTLTECEA